MYIAVTLGAIVFMPPFRTNLTTRCLIFSIALFICAVIPAWPATIGTTTGIPNSVSVGTATTVTVTSVITDTALIANSVLLQRLDSSGRVVAVVGTLHDD